MADLEARLACASACILQSPPGEVNDVFNNVRVLVGDDAALESGILPALEQYNIEQFVSAQLPDRATLMVCQAGQVPGSTSRYIEPHSATSWIFDHLNLTASQPEEVDIDEGCESIRKELEAAAERYESEHLADGVCKVFTTHQTRTKQQAVDVSSMTASVPINGESDEVDHRTADSGDNMLADEIVDTAESFIDHSSTTKSDQTDLTETAEHTGGQDAKMATAASPATPIAAEDAVLVTEAQESAVAEGHASSSSERNADAIAVPAPSSVTATIPADTSSEPVAKHFSLYFVGNKYNPSNFWTGRWRSSYTLDLSTSEQRLEGRINVNVHFFEQGNVQLATTFKPILQLPNSVDEQTSPVEIAKAVIKVISKAEEEYQLELNEAYRELSEKTFRSLRRALPVTRQKMDWAKVANYRVGSLIGGKA